MTVSSESRASASRRALARLFPLLALLVATAWPGESRAEECPLDIISATVAHGGSVTIDIPPCRASALAMGAPPTCGSATFVDFTQTQILYDHDESTCPGATGDQFEFFGPTFDTIIVQVTIDAGGGGPPPPPPPVALPGATVGAAYNEAIGPPAVATYLVTGGALPAGLLLDSGAATISGTPTEAGSFAFTITATDLATSTPVPADFTLVVGAPDITLPGSGSTTVPQGLSGSDSISASGGTAPYRYTYTGTLPPGMSLSEAGVFSGTFTTAGIYTFDVTATDDSTGLGAPFTETATYTIEVVAAAAPVAGNDAATTAFETMVSIPVTTNDTGDIDSIVLGTLPANGTAVVDGLAVEYTPEAGFDGTDAFTYTAVGPGGSSAAATVTVTVEAAPVPVPAPVANDDTATTAFETTISIHVTTNDTGDVDSIELDTLPANGTVVTNGLAVEYTPDAGFDGTDSFTYRATGEGGSSAAATVTVTVEAAPVTAPVANDDSATTAFESAVSVDVTTNDTGVIDSIAITSGPANGTAAVNGLAVDYTPGTGFSGTDTFTYTATGPGGASAAATVTVTVDALPAPVTNDDIVSTGFRQAIRIDVTANDIGVIDRITIWAEPHMGTATVDGLFIVYTPDDNHYEDDFLAYLAIGPGGSTQGSVQVSTREPGPISIEPADGSRFSLDYGAAFSQVITVSGEASPFLLRFTDIPPGLHFDETTGLLSGVGMRSGPISIIVQDALGREFMGFDYELEVGPARLTISPADLPDATVGVPYNEKFSATGGIEPYWFGATGLPEGLELAPDGTISGTPLAATTKTFVVRAADDYIARAQVERRLTVNPAVPPAPVARDDTATTKFGQAVSIPVTGNDTGAIDSIAIASEPANGTVTVDGLTLVFIPDAGFSGSDAFTYIATGPGGDSEAASVSITVESQPLTLHPASGTFQATYGKPFSQALTLSGGAPPYRISVVYLPTGLVWDEALGSIVGVPAQSGKFGFIVVWSDSAYNGGTTNFEVEIPVPTITVALTGSITIGEDEAYESVLSADGGIGPYRFRVTQGSLPAGLTLDETSGMLSGTPVDPGTYPFSIQATDANARTSDETPFEIEVTRSTRIDVGPGTLPQATAGAFYSTSLTASNGQEPYAFTATGLPAGLQLDPAGKLSGTPTEVGSFSVVVSVQDGAGVEATATLSLSVVAVKPVVAGQNVSMSQGLPMQLSLVSGGGAGPPLTVKEWSLTPESILGTLTFSETDPLEAVLDPDDDFTGTATLTYTLASPYAESDPITISLDVAPRVIVVSIAQTLAGLSATQFTQSDIFRQQYISSVASALGMSRERVTTDFMGTSLAGLLGLPARCGPLDWHSPGSPCRQPMLGDEQMPVQAPPPPRRDRDVLPPPFRLWSAGTVRFGDQVGRGGGDGFEFETSGVTLGADRRLTEDLLLGGALGYGRDITDIGDDGTRSESQSLSAVLYGSYHPDPWYLDVIFGRQELDFDLRRHIEETGTKAKGSRGGHQWLGSVAAGYEFDGEHVDVSPFARVDVATGELDAYTESGPDTYTFAYDTLDLHGTTINLGVRLDAQYQRDWGVFSPKLDLEYQHDLERDAVLRVRYADLPNGPMYRFDLPGYDRNRLMLGVGFGLLTRRHLSLQIQWRTLLGNEHRTDNSVQFSVSKRF